MKNSNAIFVLSAAMLLVGCSPYSNQQNVGPYTYKGVEYDVYEVSEGQISLGPINASDDLTNDFDYNGTLVLVRKGAGAPSSSANIISSCRLRGKARAENLERCRKVFGTALERRLNPVKEESDDMY